MNPGYNSNVIFTQNNLPSISYNAPYVISNAPEFQYLPKSELNNYIVNPPIYLEQKNFADFIDCEISMEDSGDINNNINSSSSSRSRSPMLRIKNNPINAMYQNNIRPRSPNIFRNNNVLEMDNNYNNSYEISQYSNNSPMTRSNSPSFNSIHSQSYSNSPVLTDAPVNIVPMMPAQNNINQNDNNNSNSNYKLKLYNSPIKNGKKNKKGNFSFPKTLSKSTIYKNKSNSPSINDERQVTNFQYPPVNNLIPSKIYQSVALNPFNTNYNGNALNNINNNYQSNNFPFNNNVQNTSALYKTQFQNNYQNMNQFMNTKGNISYPNNRNINSNPINNNPFQTQLNNNDKNQFAPKEENQSQLGLINSNSKTNPDISNLFKSCSNTQYSSALLSNSYFNNGNLNSRRNSSINNINVPGFDLNKEMRVKSSSSSSSDINKNTQELKNNLATVDNKKQNANLISNSQATKNNAESNSNNNSMPSDKFSQYMLDQINKIRSNPKAYVEILKKAKNCIKQDKRGNFYYSGKMKVALYKGKEAFDEAISSLEKNKPMKPLIFKKDLCIEISKDKKDFQSGDYLRKKINELIKKDIKVRAFWRDIIKDAETNFLLMIVDDNPIRRGEKRKDIMNPEMKYIGINSGMCEEFFICYTVLSDE